MINYLGSELGCDYNGKDKQSISRHYTGKHGILEKLLQEALAANDLRNIEYRKKGSSIKKNYPCKICKKDFYTKQSLRQHLTTKTHLIIAADSGISLNTHISGISTDREIADSKRKVRPISNHDLNAISKDKNIQTQIIHDSMNPPHHHIEIIAIKDMLPKSPEPVMQDRTLHEENLEIGNKQNFIQNDPLHKNCKNCQKCTSTATSDKQPDPFVLSLDDPLCIEIKEEYFKDFEAQKAHEQVNTIDFITSEDKNHIQASDNSEKIMDFNSIVVKEEQESVKVENVFSFEDPIVQSVKTEAQDSDNSEKVKNVDSIIVNENEKTDGDLSVKISPKFDHDCPAKFGEICNLCATKFAQKYDMN